MQYFNQYSLTIASLGMLILAIISLARIGAKWYAYLGVALLSVVLIVTWFFVRPRSSDLASLTAVQSQIGSGTPVLLEFQSPY